MSKDPIPLVVEDLSAFTRALSAALSRENSGDGSAPSHLTLMNMLSRAAGFRNYQHLKAAHETADRLLDPPASPPRDHKAVEKALARFDGDGRLMSWPGKRKIQTLCLWTLWAALPANSVMEERQVNGTLNRFHHFEDPALLRRCLLSEGLLTRNPDGTDYRRVETAPPPEARTLIAAVTAKRAA